MTKVLFIEDDQDQIFLYSKRLGLDNVEVYSATNSHEAFDLLGKITPDVILLDLLLGNENGLEILERLKRKKKTREITTIIFTNYEKSAVKRNKNLDQAHDFLIKLRMTPDDLAVRIKQIKEN